MTEDMPIIICEPFEDEHDLVAKGSTKVPCADCGRACWLSPTGRKLTVAEGAVAVCGDCGMKRMLSMQQAGEEFSIQPPNEEQMKEIMAELSRIWRRPPV